jgi:spermidine/putrescine transport system substrate-binding protein
MIGATRQPKETGKLSLASKETEDMSERVLDVSRPRLSRRRAVQGAAGLAAGLAVGTPLLRRAAAQETTLNWLTWPGHADPSIVGPFEEETGIKIVAKEYGSGDLGLVEIAQNPGVYDVFTTSMEFMPQYVAADLIQAMDPAEYPGWAEYLPEFQQDIGYNVDGTFYTIIYSFGFNALCYRTDQLSEEDVSSYAILADPRVSGKVGSQDWWGNTMGALSIANGNSPVDGKNPYVLTSEEFESLKQSMAELRPQFGGFWDIAGVISAFANGTIWLQPGGGDWSAQILQDQGHPVASAIPAEGGYLWGEAISIVNGTQKEEAAKQFVSYILSGPAQARISTKPSYSAIAPNMEAWTLLQEEQPEWAERLKMNTFDDPNAITPWREGRIAIRVLPEEQTVEDWQNAWTEFKEG